MRFNDNANLDTSQVEDMRGNSGGGGGGGGGGFSIGRGGLAAGGGGLGLIAVVVIVLINVLGGHSGSSTGNSQTGNILNQLGGGNGGQPGSADNTTLQQECSTAGAANSNDDCAVVAIINSVQAFWSQQLARSGTTYTESDTVFYTTSTPTGCGQGTTEQGPFYCPADKKVYIDLSFWNELKTTFGANDAPFTQAYVLAHEYGHHVQDLLGTNKRVGAGTGPTSGSVRLELQADCYAGVWAKNASTVPDAQGHVIITDITQDDLNNALQTAGKIGDDYIETQIQGGTATPSQYTHGTSAQRQKWFTTGYTSGQMTACNTFDTNSLG